MQSTQDGRIGKDDGQGKESASSETLGGATPDFFESLRIRTIAG